MSAEMKSRWKRHVLQHLILYSILASISVGFVSIEFFEDGSQFSETVVLSTLIGVFLVYPFVLTLLNSLFLIYRCDSNKVIRKGRHIEYITIILGVLYSMMMPNEIRYLEDWQAVLVNREVHTPIWTQGYLTIAVLACCGIAGYLILSFVPIKKLPPLICVCAISSMYIGIILCTLWLIQVFGRRFLLLCLFPFNCILIAVKLIRIKVFEWKMEQPPEGRIYQNRYLNSLNQRLVKADSWPLAAFLLMWPLLGLLLCILMLFGQEPDSIIKAWTETSDWHLSKRIAPPNIRKNGHYLCTVAAGGHKKVVKPLRLGERHGHGVIVNRQLCIANAFEQILEERIPVIHHHVRNFYDKYGLPIANRIHSPYIADGIYIMMKPLEWIFLIVLYFCDVNPENRIAVQYLPKSSLLGMQKERNIHKDETYTKRL